MNINMNQTAKTMFLTSEIKWPFCYKNLLFTSKYESKAFTIFWDLITAREDVYVLLELGNVGLASGENFGQRQPYGGVRLGFMVYKNIL